jgi:phenylacetate-CoA ligase
MRLVSASSNSGSNETGHMMNIPVLVNILTALRRLRQHEHWTRAELEAYQARSLRDLREYVYKSSPFYQQFHHGLIDRPLSELPVLTKAMMMEHFNDLVTDEAIRLEDIRSYLDTSQSDDLYLNRYWVTATSGSTGQPGIFLFNRAEWATVIASFARGQEWGGLKVDLFHRRKMAVVSSTSPLHMSFRVGLSAQSRWISTLRLAAADSLPDIVQQLNDFQPDILIAYASMAHILAEEQHAGRLKIKPTVVFTSSEVLTEEARQRIEAAWGEIMFNEYAATESGGLAAERREHSGLTVFEDLVILEVVDEHNRPIPAGTYGYKILLTALFKRTQPLIRYELHDSVRLAPYTSNPVGLPFNVIEDIQGRTEDVLYFSTGNGKKIAIHPNVFHRIMDTMPVSGWQVRQEADGLVFLLSGVRGAFSDQALLSKVEKALAAQNVVVPSVKIERVVAIPKGVGGKAPLIKSNVQLKG